MSSTRPKLELGSCFRPSDYDRAMAYDEALAERIRTLAVDEPDMREKKMFGGLGFMLDGHTAFTCSGQGGLMVRVNPDDADRLTLGAGVERFEMNGRKMNGWLHIDAAQLEDDEQLGEWLSVGIDFASTLPPKE